MTEPLVHPISGEILPDDLDRLVQLEHAVDRFLRSLRGHYAFRGNLRARIAELRGVAVLPAPRRRTAKQSRVACCPRCGRGEDVDAQVERGTEIEENPFHEAA